MPLSKFLQSIGNLLYPPLCFHCEASLQQAKHPLCRLCLEQFEQIPATDHAERYAYRPMGLRALEGAFFHEGPIISLLQAFKHAGAFFLAESLSAFLLLQWEALKWPYPDLLIPLPSSPFRVMRLGCDPSFLLAESLGKLLQRPVLKGLKKEWGHPPQSVLPPSERKALSKQVFSWRAKESIQGKTILLVDDLIVTGATMRASALTLRVGFPRAVYGIAVSRVYTN